MVRFGDGQEQAARSDEERSLLVTVARIETLSRECGLGFALVGACALVLALSARLSLGAGALSSLMLLFGSWFLVLGGPFHVTRELWLARLATLGWFVLALPLVLWCAGNCLDDSVHGWVPSFWWLLLPLAWAAAFIPARAVEELARHRKRLAAAIAGGRP